MKVEGTFVTHPLVREGAVEARLYQQLLVASVLQRGNTLIVAPTGLGKTIVAALVIAERLRRVGGRALFLAPTKPLAVQHAETLRKVLKVEEIGVVTGEMSPDKRSALYNRLKIITATPQTVENDILRGVLSLDDFTVLVFDEAHRAVGNYSYVTIASEYMKRAKHPLILAMTASPGGDPEKIREVIRNLHIRNVEIKTPQDTDVRPYVQEIVMEWREVELDPLHLEAIQLLKRAIKKRLKLLKEMGIVESADPEKYSRKDLIYLQSSLQSLEEPLPDATSLVAQLIKLDHALELLEAQGTAPFLLFMEKLKLRSLQPRAPRSDREIVADEDVKEAVRLAKELKERGYVHAKVYALKTIIKKFIRENPVSKIILFVQYRDTATHLVEELSSLEGVNPVRFVGQAKRGSDRGLSQKEQKALLDAFRSGMYNVLVATSVAEEGLDIPSVDLVIFYEPVPSEIRWIQRRGRTGRLGKGKVIILVAKGTRDQAYYWSAKIKEKKMLEELRRLRAALNVGQTSLYDYVEVPKPSATIEVIVDQRERSSDVIKYLIRDPEVKVILHTLPVGDYLISDRVIIERKSFSDLVESIIDGRLFSQARELSEQFARPIIIVERGPTKRNIHPNAVRGALASLAIDYGISVIFTDSPEETYNLIKIMARREQMERKRLPRVRGEKRILSLPEMQRYIVESLPFVGPSLAIRLLKHFKTVERIFTASEKELARVEGIGEKRAKEIRRVLTAEYKEEPEQANQT